MANWFKKHWQTIIIILLVLFLFRRQNPTLLSQRNIPFSGGIGQSQEMLSFSADTDSAYKSKSYLPNQPAPSEDPDRLVITDTSLSLLVKDVSATINHIQSSAVSLGGFLVNSHLSKPDSAASGNISVRVPSDKIPQALSAFKGFSVKVVSESVTGRDVTDSYTDLSARLQVLTKTKNKFEQILDQATKVSDLLDVQRELTNIQAQIDSLKGQQLYYEQSAKLSKITVYLSTDELSLPYAPSQAWRPTVIFKTAVRSLIATARSLAGSLIWVVVYSPLILVAVFAIRFFKKRQKRTQNA